MMILVVIGVSGAGKSTVGKLLAQVLHVEFYEGDDYHSTTSKEMMRNAIPLDEQDREPWLAALRELIDTLLARNSHAVIACSALKRSHRARLRRDGVQFIYLKSDPEVIRARLAKRQDHFFNPRLLESQFAILEEPRHAIVVDTNRSVNDVVQDILRQIGKLPGGALGLDQKSPGAT